MKTIINLAFISFLFVFASCISNDPLNKGDKLQYDFDKMKGAFTKQINGKSVSLFMLNNSNNMKVFITNYGGRIVSLWVPDKKKKLTDIVLGCDSVDHYMNKSAAYFGALIGRYANRISKGTFTLDNIIYQIPLNNGSNSLHGGPNGFHNQVWDAEQNNEQTLTMTYLSKDSESGYPGDLNVKVVYSLTNENSLTITYEAITNKKTVLNLTNHSFFNLNGHGKELIDNHFLWINASKYTPVDLSRIPLGTMEDVKNTPFDFRTFKQVGRDIDSKNVQIENVRGYDHNFVLNPVKKELLQEAAVVYSPKTGIRMRVLTSEPGIQFYSGNFLDGKVMGKDQANYGSRSGFCLETQHFPDSPNQPSFPSTILSPGIMYRTTTVYSFGLQ